MKVIATILMATLLIAYYIVVMAIAYAVIGEPIKEKKMKKLLKFATKECSQCKIQDRILKELNDVEIEYVDCEENPDLVDKYKIRTVPTIVVLEDEEVVKTFTGVTNIETIKEVL